MDGTRSALIVASDQYTDPGLRRLRAPASDARALAAVLRDPGIGGFEVRTLLNEPAHVVNLAVEEFFADRRPGDLLLVHFSGHGIKDEDGELYFAASNTVLGRLGATAVAAEFVSRRMNRSRSRRVVLLLDCCYAGAFERGLVARAGTEMGIEQQFGGRGRAVITASSAMEYAFEAGELADTHEVPPSVFTSALVEGLETGEADRDQDGLVGLDELYDYVYDKVRAATPNQTPGKWTFGMEGELYIARRSRPVTTPAPLPPELQQAMDSPLAGVRAGAVQELAAVLRGRHAGMALAARLALEQLTDDDSRTVAAAAAVALAEPPLMPGPAPPKLAVPVTSIDFGLITLDGPSPERRVRLGGAAGGSLNAQRSTSANWLKLREANDELVISVDTSTAGEYEDTVAIDSAGGSATIRVRAQVGPAPRPTVETLNEAHSGPEPEAAKATRQDPVSPVPGKAVSQAAPRAPGRNHTDRAVLRRWVVIIGAAIAVVIGLIISLSNSPAGHQPEPALDIKVGSTGSLGAMPARVLRNDATLSRVASGTLSPNAQGSQLEWTLKVPPGAYQVCVDPPAGLTFIGINTYALHGWFCSFARVAAGRQTPIAFQVTTASP